MKLVNPGYFMSNIIVLFTFVLSSHQVLATTVTGIATSGYIYGFPIVLMDETREGMTGPYRSCTLGADINHFRHVFELPDEEFKAVVRPNVDTLYSSAMLDLSEGPVVMTLPEVKDRYVLMALLDAWTNNFDGITTASERGLAGNYFITGPKWRGRIPNNHTHIKATTDLVWVVGRTELLGEDDISAVNDLQKQYKLSPYRRSDERRIDVDCIEDDEREKTPKQVVLDLPAEEFFARLSRLMAENPPPRDNIEMEMALARIGVGRFAYHDVSDLSRLDKAQLEMGKSLAQGSMNSALRLLGLSGWGPNPKLIPLGDYDERYFIRAMVAQIGFGANKNEYAVYQNSERDSDHERLTGEHEYTFTLKADDMPDSGAFWSITAYNDEGYLTENGHAKNLGLARHALGSNSGLQPDRNGDITLYISVLPPQGVPLSNWLPVPDGQFQLTLRFYAPGEAILNNEWEIPGVIKQ